VKGVVCRVSWWLGRAPSSRGLDIRTVGDEEMANTLIDVRAPRRAGNNFDGYLQMPNVRKGDAANDTEPHQHRLRGGPLLRATSQGAVAA
jgi:hypothetical protein